MIDTIVQYACENATLAAAMFACLILLAGISVPISIDVILISSGALASTCLPEHAVVLFIVLFLACWIAAWEAYWIGRIVGPKLYNIRWFGHILTLKRIEMLHYYYEKFGFLTFMVGRFIPGGVRNALFMTSGLGKMPFYRFILRDFPACLLNSAFLYGLGYMFGSNYEVIVRYFKRYNTAVIVILLILMGVFLALHFYRKRSEPPKENP